jgi:hypothetical protein
MVLHNNIIFFSYLYFIEGQRGACAYIIVIFATLTLASSLRVIRSMLEVRE